MNDRLRKFDQRSLALVALVLSSLFIQLAKADPYFTNSPMATARAQHTATLLPNGKVLVAGGNNSDGDLSSAELYDSAAKTWTPTGAMPSTRNSATATLLSDGRVLVAGGYDGNGICSTASLYDPATGKWTDTDAMTTSHYAHTMTLLANGKVLVAGGTDGRSGGAKSIPSSRRTELYDPATGKWITTGSMTTPRAGHTATLLLKGKVLVAGGYTDGMGGIILASAELYNPANGRWARTGSLNTERCSHTATLLPNGKVLVTGGFGGTNSAMTSAELFDPATEKWTVIGSMNDGHSDPTSTLLSDGRVLVVGGASAELYQPATGTWTVAFSLNPMLAYHTATLLPNGQVLVAGGFYNGIHLSNTELFNPAAEK